MRYYPIFVDLRGRRAAVVGGGRVGERKVRALLRAQARVHVISPALTARLARLAAQKKIRVTRRGYKKGDLDHSLLVFAATNDPATQKAVREEAVAAGALVNSARDPGLSDFLVPASFARGDLHVAISTSGASPALARILRRELQKTLGQKFRQPLQTLRAARARVKLSIDRQSDRAKIFRKLVARIREVKGQKSKGKGKK